MLKTTKALKTSKPCPPPPIPQAHSVLHPGNVVVKLSALVSLGTVPANRPTSPRMVRWVVTLVVLTLQAAAQCRWRSATWSARTSLSGCPTWPVQCAPESHPRVCAAVYQSSAHSTQSRQPEGRNQTVICDFRLCRPPRPWCTPCVPT